MPLTVPGKRQDRLPAGITPPSETDMLMALAVMKDLGRVPTFDERFRGQDPSSLPIDVQQQGQPVYGQPKDNLLLVRPGMK